MLALPGMAAMSQLSCLSPGDGHFTPAVLVLLACVVHIPNYAGPDSKLAEYFSKAFAGWDRPLLIACTTLSPQQPMVTPSSIPLFCC